MSERISPQVSSTVEMPESLGVKATATPRRVAAGRSRWRLVLPVYRGGGAGDFDAITG